MQSPLPFSYQIRRSRRKTLAVHIKNAVVEVRAPYGLPALNIQQWLQEKTGWIETHLKKQQHQQQEKPQLCHNGQILFLGQIRQIELIDGKPAIYEQQQQLIIARQANTDIQKLIEQWLRCEAELYLTARTQELAAQMGESNRISDIRFRKTRSKWGHCTSGGILQFNWLIIMAPPDVIDYLIIHELSHLQHMNHSAAFWQRVAVFCPGYASHKQWLHDNGHKLWL